MKQNIPENAKKYIKAHQRKKRWYMVVTCLACVVVACTVYALIRPAITMIKGACEIPEHTHSEACYTQVTSAALTDPVYTIENLNLHQHDDACFEAVEEPADTETLTCANTDEGHTHTALCYGTWELTCGLEEHTHSLDCYSDPTADVETEEQWKRTFADVKLTGEWRQDVIAIAKTQLGYTESSENYAVGENGSLHGYTRYGDWYGSPYGDWSAMFVSFCIHYANVKGMPLDGDCQTWISELQKEDVNLYSPAHAEESRLPSVGDLIFFDRDDDGQPDRVGLVAELIPETENSPAKVKTIEGDAPKQVQYVTSELDDSAVLGIGWLPEQKFCCGQTGHAHESSCLDSRGEPVCGLDEHIHSDTCNPPKELPQNEPVAYCSGELTANGSDYTVRVKYGEDAVLPEGVILTVTEIPENSEEYRAYLRQAVEAMEAEGQPETVVFARFFDIRFLVDGKKVEPTAPVEVTITYSETVDTGEDVNFQAVHFAEKGTEILDAAAEALEDGSTSFTHTQNGFSVVGDVGTVSADNNTVDSGPNELPVDYYVNIDGEWVYVGTTKTGWYGDYTTSTFTNTNRDCITLDQVSSILSPYGFDATAENPALQLGYQRKETNLNPTVYCDTQCYSDPSKSDSVLLPISRNADQRSGYNLYYLPGNTNNQLSAHLDSVPMDGSRFYTVSVFDSHGQLLKKSAPILTGGSFTYNASETGVTNWLVCYSSGSTDTYSDSIISLTNITSTVSVSPVREGTAGSHSVTFKVMIDGQWQTVGSLPYYYTGTVNGSQRAYITSDMAAQFFGDFGYTANMDPGYRFGYSYNDIYRIFYFWNGTVTNYCMDVNGNSIANNTAVQLYESNGSSAQVFRIWPAGDGYYYITPVENSAYHVNVLGGGTANETKLGIHTATDYASHWKLVSYSNGTVSFYTRNAPDTMCIDLPRGDVTNFNQLQIYNQSGGARYWKLNQQYRISNNIVSSQNNDGTYNIGLSPESNGDIVCYYMPAETASTYTNVSESAVSAANSFWSVCVRDDTNTVYSDGELSSMVRYVQPGGEATVTVKNAGGILWSCRGMKGQPLEVESDQSGGYTTFVIKDIAQPVEVVATKSNPSFTVQYYANIPRIAASGGAKSLYVIDTSGSNVPKNGSQLTYRYLQLEIAGGKTSKNRGYATDLYRVKTNVELTKMYTEQQFQYESSPGLAYFNKLKDNENYVLKEIWILKAGKDSNSTNRSDWDIYTYQSDTSFTNEAGQAIGNTLLICDGAVIRLVSDSSTGDYYNDTTFFDYNIASKKNSDGYWETGIVGINSKANYGTSRNGQRYWDLCTANGWDLFAFGNRNCGSGLGKYLFVDCYLNGNGWGEGINTGKTRNDWNCTFGLVDKLDSNGNLVYNERLIVPNLFNDGEAIGKQTYAGSSLAFDRVGDTYTLSAATLKNSNGQYNTISQLQYFFNPSPANASNESTGTIPGGVTYTNIFTNDFWPMDQAASRTDPLFGDYDWAFWQSDNRYNGFNPYGQGGTVAENHYYFPKSDDGWNHNCFFGMNYAITFNLTTDYEGPMEFYFFGDDDLWVFLDGRLVCDIGGVHSSVGEYVNLRDYLPVGSSGQHTLSFFYTERGASGSTCWMSFTLPSVSSAITSREIGSLQIAKAVEETNGADFSGEEYKFKVELLTAQNGSALNQTFSYSRSDNTYGTIRSGGTIVLHKGEEVTISGIPAGTFYQVTELTTEGYHTTVNGHEGYITSGNIETGNVKKVSFVNRPYLELPNTGGDGTSQYIMEGILLVTGAASLLLYLHVRRKKEDFTSF